MNYPAKNEEELNASPVSEDNDSYDYQVIDPNQVNPRYKNYLIQKYQKLDQFLEREKVTLMKAGITSIETNLILDQNRIMKTPQKLEHARYYMWLRIDLGYSRGHDHCSEFSFTHAQLVHLLSKPISDNWLQSP